MSKRKSISKKLRFEIFKRDMFTCQYCGKKAPEIILNIDHIKPVSKGGDNNILNLITSCFDCNSGKKNILLSDTSCVLLKQKQIEKLQLRQEQIKMIAEWHNELLEQEEVSVKFFTDFFSKICNMKISFNDSAVQNIKRLINIYGIDEVFKCTKIAVDRYVKFNNNSPSIDSINYAFNKIGGVCFNRKQRGLI